MNRWKVAQHIISNAWLAWDDDDAKESPIRLMDRTVRSFRTHAEALAYADKKARTVEVTLPRIGSQFTCKQRATPSYDDITLTRVNPTNYQIRYAEDMGEDGRGIDMLADELKPLALALLAHHYRNQP